MMLHFRCLDICRRHELASYAQDVLATLRDVEMLVDATGPWESRSGAVPKDEDGIIGHLAKCQVRNNVGDVMQGMGVSERFFLPVTVTCDVYITFHLAVSSRHTAESVVCELDSGLANWDEMLVFHESLIETWAPKMADIMNWYSLDILSEDLPGKTPVGFACFRSGTHIGHVPQEVNVVSLPAGTLLHLKSPRFDASLEEAEQLRELASIFDSEEP